MRFFIVHELETSEGVRLRARADRHFSLSEAEGLADALDAVEGVEGVRVNPLVGSVLLLFLGTSLRLWKLTCYHPNLTRLSSLILSRYTRR